MIFAGCFAAFAHTMLGGAPEADKSAGALITPRDSHTATLLADGRVLLAGGYDANAQMALDAAEVYDRATNSWSATGNLNEARYQFGAVRLLDGRVLAVGGDQPLNVHVLTAEIYDPTTGTWTFTASPSVPHSYFDPVLLPDGKVLVAGGYNGVDIATAELYDPVTGTWSLTGSLGRARSSYRAVLLRSGKVLIAGGLASDFIAPCELYDPATGSFTDTGNLNFARVDHVAVLLKDDRALVAGGFRSTGGKVQVLDSTEIYDPATALWTRTGSLTSPRELFTANLLPNGRVVAVAGSNLTRSYIALDSIEEYDPVHGAWRLLPATLATARKQHTTTSLLDGSLIVAGGVDTNNDDVPAAELFVWRH